MIKTGKKDLVWSFLSTFASYGISLILTPIIVIYLPTEELGLWYTFASIAVIMDMLDLGFAAALRRNITYSWMGAKELIKEGCPVIQGDKPNLYLFVKIYEATRIIRIFVSIIGALLLTIFGSIYISYVMRDYSGSSYLIAYSGSSYLIAWLIYSGSLAIGSFFAYISIVYEGTGNIAISQKGILIGKFTQVVSAIIFVICGYGIIGLSIGFLIAEIAKRIYYWYVFEKIVITKSQIKKINKEIKRGEIKEIIRIIWFNAKKVGFSSICTSIMSQLGTLICSGILGVTIRCYNHCNIWIM